MDRIMADKLSRATNDLSRSMSSCRGSARAEELEIFHQSPGGDLPKAARHARGRAARRLWKRPHRQIHGGARHSQSIEDRAFNRRFRDRPDEGTRRAGLERRPITKLTTCAQNKEEFLRYWIAWQ